MVKSYMNKFKEQLIHFMRGRYGGDLLNNVLLWVLVIFQVLNIFLKNPALHLLINMIFVYALYRIMSKNIWARQKENLRFLDLTKDIRNRFKVIERNSKDKDYKCFICPNCKQMVKVPRGKGRIVISCPRCKSNFDRRS